MTLPSKSGGFQLPKIEIVSSHMCVESPDILYFDWDLTPYIQKVRHGEMKVETVKIVSTFKKSGFWPMYYYGTQFLGLSSCLNNLR